MAPVRCGLEVLEDRRRGARRGGRARPAGAHPPRDGHALRRTAGVPMLLDLHQLRHAVTRRGGGPPRPAPPPPPAPRGGGGGGRPAAAAPPRPRHPRAPPAPPAPRPPPPHPPRAAV